MFACRRRHAQSVPYDAPQQDFVSDGSIRDGVSAAPYAPVEVVSASRPATGYRNSGRQTAAAQDFDGCDTVSASGSRARILGSGTRRRRQT
jgi:hypothetical protein